MSIYIYRIKFNLHSMVFMNVVMGYISCHLHLLVSYMMGHQGKKIVHGHICITLLHYDGVLY